MATQLQIRRGTAAQVAAFTGAEGEIVYNSTNDSLHTNDGSTAGGFELARVDGSNFSSSVSFTTLSAATFSVSGAATFSGDIDVDGTTNLDVVDIDGAVDMASTLTVAGLTTFSNDVYVIDGTGGRVVVDDTSTNGAWEMGAGVVGARFAIRNQDRDSEDFKLDNATGAATFNSSVTTGGKLALGQTTSFPTTGLISHTNNYLYMEGGSGGIILRSASGGSQMMFITPAEVVVNNDSTDSDFRVESDNLTHALFVQGSDGFVGVGVTAPSYPLEVQSGGVGTVLRAGTSFVSIDSTGSAASPSLIFNGDGDTGIYRSGSDALTIATAGTDRLTIASNGAATFSSSVTAGGNIVITGDNVLDVTQGNNSSFFKRNASQHISVVSDSSQHRLLATGSSDKSFIIANTTGAITFSPANTVAFNIAADGAATFTPAAGGHAVFNENSVDADFRVESDTNANALFVQGSDGRIGVGTGTSLDNQLEVAGGNVRVRGTTTPSLKFNNNELETIAIKLNSGSTGTLGLRDNKVLIDSNGGFITTPAANGHAVFNEGGVDADFRVESDNKSHMLFVDSSLDFVGFETSTRINSSSTTGFLTPAGGICIETQVSGGNGYYAMWIHNTAGTQTGYIYNDGSATSYNTSSDERLKENILDAEDAGSLIDDIQVRSFDWKETGEHQRYGMIAQELQTVAPEAVHEPEDADAMMAVDYSILVPMLIKEIQSLRQRVAQLEE